MCIRKYYTANDFETEAEWQEWLWYEPYRDYVNTELTAIFVEDIADRLRKKIAKYRYNALTDIGCRVLEKLSAIIVEGDKSELVMFL